MEKFFDVSNNCPLFIGMDEYELQTVLHCFSATQKTYEKDSFVFMAGEAARSVGIVLRGSVLILCEDYWGNRTILDHIEPGGLFGAAFSCAGTERLPVSVCAVTTSDILLIDYRKVITTCSSACTFHAELIKNMLRILAQKNVMLSQKIEFITRRTTREKLLAYLSAQAQLAGGNSFTIPYNRQELADYLSVDRSAMSSQLSKMKKEGVLTFRRNCFELLEMPRK